MRRILRSALFFIQLQRGRIDAIAQSCRLRTIVKDVPQVRAATAASHFGSLHSMRGVCRLFDNFGLRGIVEAGPAAPRMKLRFRTEKFLSTTHALISPGRLGIF